MNKFSFPKALKLKSEKSISELFEKGYSLSSSPLRLLWHINLNTGSGLPKAGFSTSKKNYKRAVDRNLLKRRMREAYRLNKEILFVNAAPLPPGLEIMFLYTSREILSYKSIETSMISVLTLLQKKLKRTNF